MNGAQLTVQARDTGNASVIKTWHSESRNFGIALLEDRPRNTPIHIADIFPSGI